MNLAITITSIKKTDGPAFNRECSREKKEPFFSVGLIRRSFCISAHVTIGDKTGINQHRNELFAFKPREHPGKYFCFQLPGAIFISKKPACFLNKRTKAKRRSGPFGQDAGFGLNQTKKNVGKSSLQTGIGSNTK
jgi:hypothetical protein